MDIIFFIYKVEKKLKNIWLFEKNVLCLQCHIKIINL